MVFQCSEDAVKQLPTLTDRVQGQSVATPRPQPPSEYPRVYVSLRKPSRATPGSNTPAWDAVKAGNRGDGRRERREKCF